MISETQLLWSLPTSLDWFVFDMPHRVYGNIYDILIALLSHYSIRGCPNVSHTEPGPGYVVKRDPLHCSSCLDVRGKVHMYIGCRVCCAMYTYHDMIWSDMAICFDMICYGVVPLFWYLSVVAPMSGGCHVMFFEFLGRDRTWYDIWFCTHVYVLEICIWYSGLCISSFVRSVSGYDFVLYSGFTYSIHISYWPPFFRGCVFMPRRYWRQICWTTCLGLYSAILGRSFVQNTYFGTVSAFVYMYDIQGYDGALSRLMILLCSVEVCKHTCGFCICFGLLWSVIALSASTYKICPSVIFNSTN